MQVIVLRGLFYSLIFSFYNKGFRLLSIIYDTFVNVYSVEKYLFPLFYVFWEVDKYLGL